MKNSKLPQVINGSGPKELAAAVLNINSNQPFTLILSDHSHGGICNVNCCNENCKNKDCCDNNIPCKCICVCWCSENNPEDNNKEDNKIACCNTSTSCCEKIESKGQKNDNPDCC